MRKVKLVFVLGMICLSFLLLSKAGHAPASPNEPLSTALALTGANVAELSVNGWGKLPDADLTDNQLERLVAQAMGKLGVSEYQLTKNTNAHHRMLRAEALGNKFHAVAIVQVLYPYNPSSPPEAYLVVNVETTPEGKTSADWQEKIAAGINAAGGVPRISTCLVGWLDGKLDDGEWVNRLQTAFEAIGATVVDKVNYANFASFTGYSPAVADSLEIGDKRINVNLAMRYSPYDNRTYVIIGSPVITREY